MYGNPSFSGSLNLCAIECALRRFNRKCKNRFGSAACTSCNQYIGNYIQADPRHIRLFMMQAEQKASRLKVASRMGLAPLIMAVLFIGGCGTLLFLSERETDRINAESQARRTYASTSIQQTSYNRNVTQTLNRVAVDLRNNVDVNRDGKINCVDAAVLFYQYYPNKNDVRITLNKHPTNGFNHLFNMVRINGVWRGVEPQSVFAGHNSFYMTDAWPQKYDHQFNQDATSKYSVYSR